MNLKLEITGVKTLKPQQREAIQQKLVEIKTIVKNEKKNSESRAGRVVEKIFNKLRYENKKEDRQWLTKQSIPHHPLQSENKTLPQSALCDESCNGKRLLIEKEPPLRVQFHGSERQRATIHSIFQRTQAESNLLEITLDQMFRLEKRHSQQCGTSQVSDLERFLLQVDNFQKQVKLQVLPLFENIHHNEI